jgi:ADP-ribose pyrophosphatase YjhB (NUDIX family)
MNCGKYGHLYKICGEPRMSYGIIALHSDDQEITDKLIKYCRSISSIDPSQINSKCASDIERFAIIKQRVGVLMVMRKHTIGYMEFIKGRYCETNKLHVQHLIDQMTPGEVQFIVSNHGNFPALWQSMWPGFNLIEIDDGKPTISESSKVSASYKRRSMLDYSTANDKYARICNKPYVVDLFHNHKVSFSHPEWGFPKGRRTQNEHDIESAQREFAEETGYTDKDYLLFENIQPIVENIIGSDGLHYCYRYHVAVLTSSRPPLLKYISDYQQCEIGDIGLFTIDDAICKVRDYLVERRNILYTVFTNIISHLLLIA